MMKYEVTEYKDEKCTVRIHRPILTENEREARLKDVRAALVQFGRERIERCQS